MERFEYTKLAVMKEERKYRMEHHKEGYDLERMMSTLIEHAADEPRVLKAQIAGEIKKKEPSYGSSTSNKEKKGSSAGNKNKTPTTNPVTQMNNVRTEEKLYTFAEVQLLLSQREKEPIDQAQVLLNAVGKPGGKKGGGEFKCYNCGKPDHMARECPLPDKRVCKKCGAKGQHKYIQVSKRRRRYR